MRLSSFFAFLLGVFMFKKLLVFLVVCWFSSGFASSYPLSIIDDLGRSITLKSEPKRIIAMLPSHTETIFALGAGAKLVGIDEYSNYPKLETSKIQKVGNGFVPNLEAIAALKPDLVLADESTSSKLVSNLEKLGLTVYGGTAQTYLETFEKMAVLGRLVNRESNALRLITNMRSEINEITSKIAGRAKVSAYFEVDPTPYAAGATSFIGEMLSRAGGVNILPASLGAFPQISPELVVSTNPSVIIGATLEDLLLRPGWANITAIKNKRVYNPTGEDNDAIVRPGPRLATALKILVRFLHPDVKL
jgi:iron complex transport system substrate-binding protein